MSEALTEVIREYKADYGDPDIAQRAEAELRRYQDMERAIVDFLAAFPTKHFGEQNLRLRRVLARKIQQDGVG